jgi:transposase
MLANVIPTEELRMIVRVQMARKNINKGQLAKSAGLSRQTVSRFFNEAPPAGEEAQAGATAKHTPFLQESTQRILQAVDVELIPKEKKEES